MSFPKKLLIIKDLTFILPPEFKGNLCDALHEYIKYRNAHVANSKIVDVENKHDTTDEVLMNHEDVKSCILYGIVEIDENGKYTVIESSNSNEILTTQ